MMYTHRDVEADRRKPVGSLFFSEMGNDSFHPPIHRCESARARYDRSLPGTALCMYDDADVSAATGGSISARNTTPVRGKRCYAGRSNRQTYTFGDAAETPPRRASRPHHDGVGRADHLTAALVPARGSSRSDFSERGARRHLRPPSADRDGRRSTNIITDPWNQEVGEKGELQKTSQSRSGTPLVRRGRADSRDMSSADGGSAGAPTPRRAASAPRAACQRARSGHLATSTLVPREEPPVEKPVPPPMVLKPRTKGIRLFPQSYTQSWQLGEAEEEPGRLFSGRGVKMVQPPPHWKSVTERQMDFLTIGIAREDGPFVPPSAAVSRTRSAPRSISGGPPSRDGSDDGGAAASSDRCSSAPRGRGYVDPSPQQRWRGRASSAAAPPRRTFDIITGRPL